jgi:phage terminase Nu1 subunit (DNA packaging protein)
MAASCGVSVQAFAQWNVAPVAKIGRYAYYKVSDVIANRLARQMLRLAQEADGRGNDPEALEAEREKVLLTREQRIGQELKNAQTRRELAPVQLIEWTLSRIGSQISAIFDSIPLKVKKLMPKLSASEIELIKRELVKAQNAAARVTVNLDEYYEMEKSQ